MSSLYENFNTGDNDASGIGGANQRAQTFTVGEIAHTISSVKLLLYRTGTPGTLTVTIKAVDANHRPTGDALTSGTINANDFTTDTAGAWYEINLTEYTLSSNTEYAIVLSAATTAVMWRGDFTEPGGYGSGIFTYSTDSGGSWAELAGDVDAMFEVWGNALPPPAVGRSYGYVI